MFIIGKLQEIKKPNDRVIYMCYPPVSTIQELEWSKGDELEFSIVEGRLVISKIGEDS